MGSKGGSYDNALTEIINGLYEAELIRRRAPCVILDGGVLLLSQVLGSERTYFSSSSPPSSNSAHQALREFSVG